MLVQIHETFRHDCTDFPDEEKYEQFRVTRPYQFRKGDEADVPDDVADYFIRAGWAATDGDEPVKPDKSKPVFVQPHNGTLGVKDSRPK